MFRVFRSEWYQSKLKKLDKSELIRVLKFEKSLKTSPYSGKPLGYKFFREKKFDGKRLLFLVYEEQKCVFLITIVNKKIQQEIINLIKLNLEKYKKELEKVIKNL